jgi:hypothetical protein
MAQHLGHASGGHGDGHRGRDCQTEEDLGKMNRKQFVILLMLVVALVAAGLWIHKRNQTSWKSAGKRIGQKLLADLPVNDLAQVVIRSGTNELSLARKEGTWRVRERSDYPANFDEIGSLLLKLADLKAVQTEEVGPSQLSRYQLLPPGRGANSGTLIAFKDQTGKTLKSLLVGKPHLHKAERSVAMEEFGDTGWPDGRYVTVDGGAKTVALVSDPLTQIEPKPERWLDRDFFKVAKTKAVFVEFQSATNSWKVTRDTENADWRLAEAGAGERLDSSKVPSLNYALSSPSFDDVLPPDTKPEQTGLDRPTVVTLETFDNFIYTLQIGAKTNDDYPLTVRVTANLAKERTPGKNEKPEDKDKLDKEFRENLKKSEEKLAQEQSYAKWIYLVPSWTLDSVLKERSQILEGKEVKKNEEPPASSASTNSVNGAGAPADVEVSRAAEPKSENEQPVELR